MVLCVVELLLLELLLLVCCCVDVLNESMVDFCPYIHNPLHIVSSSSRLTDVMHREERRGDGQYPHLQKQMKLFRSTTSGLLLGWGNSRRRH